MPRKTALKKLLSCTGAAAVLVGATTLTLPAHADHAALNLFAEVGLALAHLDRRDARRHDHGAYAVPDHARAHRLKHSVKHHRVRPAHPAWHWRNHYGPYPRYRWDQADSHRDRHQRHDAHDNRAQDRSRDRDRRSRRNGRHGD